MNIAHYIPDDLDAETCIQTKNCVLTGPKFIGQGLTKRVGSDSYASYIVARKEVKGKTIWGICSAKTVMAGKDWTDGDMDCSIDMATAKPTSWIIARGRTNNGNDKWWFCDENGKRENGHRAMFSWNGAYAYLDPSF